MRSMALIITAFTLLLTTDANDGAKVALNSAHCMLQTRTNSSSRLVLQADLLNPIGQGHTSLITEAHDAHGTYLIDARSISQEQASAKIPDGPLLMNITRMDEKTLAEDSRHINGKTVTSDWHNEYPQPNVPNVTSEAPPVEEALAQHLAVPKVAISQPRLWLECLPLRYYGP